MFQFLSFVGDFIIIYLGFQWNAVGLKRLKSHWDFSSSYEFHTSVVVVAIVFCWLVCFFLKCQSTKSVAFTIKSSIKLKIGEWIRWVHCTSFEPHSMEFLSLGN